MRPPPRVSLITTPRPAGKPGKENGQIMKYTVKNVYGVKGQSSHRTPEAAIRAARTREGAGWVVVDQDGNQWDDAGAGRAAISRSAAADAVTN